MKKLRQHLQLASKLADPDQDWPLTNRERVKSLLDWSKTKRGAKDIW